MTHCHVTHSSRLDHSLFSQHNSPAEADEQELRVMAERLAPTITSVFRLSYNVVFCTKHLAHTHTHTLRNVISHPVTLTSYHFHVNIRF
jgi:hypothetical protein